MEPAGGRTGRRNNRLSGRRPSGVRRVYDDKAYLYQIIETIGSGPDLTAILRGIVRLVTEATQCHACFVYFQQDGELVLRAASSMYVHLEGAVRLKAGEGLTGWVAKTRRSAFIRDNALEDPRVSYVPELEEEQFQSLVSVPIFSRAGEVIGVITLHAVAPHEFGRADLDFLEHTAPLVAGAIENARLYEDATGKVALLTELSKLSQQIASASGVGNLLPMVAAQCRSLIGAASCEIYLFEPDRRLVLRAASPDRARVPSLDLMDLWLEAVKGPTTRPESDETRALASALWGGTVSGTPLFVPMVVGEERLGVLCALAVGPVSGVAVALEAIASHTALAVKQHQLIEWLEEKNLVKDFFETLSRGDGGSDDLASQADRLGVAIEHPNIVLHAIPWTVGSRHATRTGRRSGEVPHPVADWRELVGRMESGITAAIRGVVFDPRQNSVRALIPLQGSGGEPVVEVVRRIYQEVVAGHPELLTIGLSDACRGIGSFERGFEEAAAAAQIGALLGGGAGVFTYEGLGAYRYALMSDETVRDRYQERLERLVQYERRRRTELLGTLEAYLDTRGNIARTSRALYIHPNTLRQRLARVERVAGLKLDREDWLSLAIAVKVVRLRQMRKAALEERREDD